MEFVEHASSASAWRGYKYYTEDKVKSLTESVSGVFVAEVIGTASEPYIVRINVAQPKSSTCNCPHASKGDHVVCKHMIAAYFHLHPEKAVIYYQEYLRELDEAAESDEYEEDIHDIVQAYVENMEKDELQDALLRLLSDCPEWLFNRFVKENYLDMY
jgi:uncharacterized Zn finger protein